MTTKMKEDEDYIVVPINNNTATATTSTKNNASNKCMEFSLDLNAQPQEDGYISSAQEREHIIEKNMKVGYPKSF